jgi:hypothetical protein
MDRSLLAGYVILANSLVLDLVSLLPVDSYLRRRMKNNATIVVNLQNIGQRNT